MRELARVARWGRAAVVAAIVAGAVSAVASDNVKGVGPFDPRCETVGIFEGITSGKLDVKLIPKDATRCRLVVVNKTARPLNVKVPDVLAAAPVLGQFGDPLRGPGRQNPNQQANNGASQAVGFPFASNMNGGRNMQGNNPLFNVPGGGQNFGPGFFNIPPETVGQFKLQSVCLEHGKPNPRPAIAYELQPIEKLADKPELVEVLKMLGRKEVDQKTAQAAAWHLNNRMSWKQVAAVRIRHLAGANEPFFTSGQVAAAKKAVERAGTIVAGNKPAASASVSMR
jgi:hypothetical protein